MWTRKKNVLVIGCSAFGLALFDVFYFIFVIPFSEASTDSNFWAFFAGWFIASFKLAEWFGRSANGASSMTLVAAVVLIVGGASASVGGGKLISVFGPLLPGWYTGLIPAAVIFVVRKPSSNTEQKFSLSAS